MRKATMIMARFSFKITLCFFLFLLSSCITKSLWRDSSYKEKITQVLSDNSGRYVVLVGERFHYVVVENSGVLRGFLSLKQKKILEINYKKSHLKLDTKNQIEGEIVIDGSYAILPQEDKDYLQSRRIFPNKYNDLTIKMKVTGRRYASKYIGGQGDGNADAIKEIEIFYDDSNAVANVGRAAITPVTLALDSVLLIGKVVLLPFSNE